MTALVAVSALSKGYGSTRVLTGVTFRAPAGEVVGLIGPNGAGKTTLLRLIVGLLRPDGGEVRLDGGVVPDVLSRVPISYFAGEHTLPGSVRIGRWQSMFSASTERTDRRRARTLSRGTRQLAGLRAVLASAPGRVCVLDEPWEGLDPDASRWLTETLRARRDGGAAVLVSSHRLHDLAGVCDRYVFLHGGVATSMAARDVEPASPVTGGSLMAMFDRIRGSRA